MNVRHAHQQPTDTHGGRSVTVIKGNPPAILYAVSTNVSSSPNVELSRQKIIGLSTRNMAWRHGQGYFRIKFSSTLQRRSNLNVDSQASSWHRVPVQIFRNKFRFPQWSTKSVNPSQKSRLRRWRTMVVGSKRLTIDLSYIIVSWFC